MTIISHMNWIVHSDALALADIRLGLSQSRLLLSSAVQIYVFTRGSTTYTINAQLLIWVMRTSLVGNKSSILRLIN